VLRGNPSAALATISAKPEPAFLTSSFVTVLNSAELVAIAPYTRSGDPSDLSIAATCDAASLRAASSPTARAKPG
jgi:hypothetical protein